MSFDIKKVSLLEARLSRPASDSNGASEHAAANNNNSLTPTRTPKRKLNEPSGDSVFKTPPSTQSTKKKRAVRFSAEEDAKIVQGYKQFGNDWHKVMQWCQFEQRTKDQIASRFNRKLKGAVTVSPPPPPPPSDSTLSAAVTNASVSSTSSAPRSVAVVVDSGGGAGGGELDAAQKQSWAELAAVRAELAEKERLLASQLASVEQQWRARCAVLVRDALVGRARSEQQLTRMKLEQQSVRLGHITVERHGSQFSEVWQDGLPMRELKTRLVALEARRAQLESARRSAKRSSTADDEDAVRIQLAIVKRDEVKLSARLAALEAEKQAHVRALRRVADEDASRFNDQPALRNERYLLLQLLGRGGFSEVYEAYDLVEFRRVAVKIHQLSNAWSHAKKENYTKHACREYNIQRQLQHERVVALLDVFEIDRNSFATVLEYCAGDDLDARLRRHKTLPEREARHVVAQVLAGLQYLASQPNPVIHYDLKPANILFDAHNNAKIADFGLSKVMSGGERSIELTSHGAGTYWYLPPECFSESSGAKISLKVDVWSVGVIFFQMLYGFKPFGNGLSQQRILSDSVIANAKSVEFPAKPNVSAAAKQFIQRLLSAKPEMRPTVFEAANDAYLSHRK